MFNILAVFKTFWQQKLFKFSEPLKVLMASGHRQYQNLISSVSIDCYTNPTEIELKAWQAVFQLTYSSILSKLSSELKVIYFNMFPIKL